TVKIFHARSGPLSCRRNLPPALSQEAQHGLTLEFPNQAVLGARQPFIRRDRAAGRLLQVQGQVLGLDRSRWGEDDSALRDVLELAEVPRPGVPLHEVERLSRD